MFKDLDSTCMCNRLFEEYLKRCNEIKAFSWRVAEQGLDFLSELVNIVVNVEMQVEDQKYLG